MFAIRLESNSSQSSSGKQNNGTERWGPDKMRNMDSNSSKMEVTIGEDLQDNRPVVKERPIWLTESTVVENTSTRVIVYIYNNNCSYKILFYNVQIVFEFNLKDSDKMNNKDSTEGAPVEFTPDVDIMTVLLQHEKRAGQTDGTGKKNGPDGDSSDEDFSKTIKNEPSVGSGNTNLIN